MCSNLKSRGEGALPGCRPHVVYSSTQRRSLVRGARAPGVGSARSHRAPAAVPVILPQYPFTLQDPSDVPIAECWYAHPDVPSCSSLAMWDQRKAGQQVGPTTPMVPTHTHGQLKPDVQACSSESAPLSSWIFPT